MDYNVLSSLVIKRVYSAMSILTEENARAKRVDRPCWAVVIKYEGETVYTVDGKNIVSNANNPVILPKGSSYEWQCVRGGHYSVVEFDCDLTYNGIFGFNIKNSEGLLRQFKHMEYVMTSKKPMYELHSIRNTYSIILDITESLVAHYINSDKKKKIQPAIDFIAKNFNKEIRNDYLAKECNMSTVYFRKLFKEIIGTSPITFTHNLRIEKSKEMLKSDYGSITDIALSLGYNNVYEFSKAFKKYTGISPSKY